MLKVEVSEGGYKYVAVLTERNKWQVEEWFNVGLESEGVGNRYNSPTHRVLGEVASMIAHEGT